MEQGHEITRLKDEITELYSKLDMAGQFGNTLIENNKEYANRIEELSRDVALAAVKTEELKQENHVLRSRIETETTLNRDHAFEQEHLKERLQKEFKEKEKSQQSATEKKLRELRKEIESLQNDLSKHTLVESQLQEKIKKQEEIIENVRRYNEQLQSKAVLENEVEEQKSICAHLQIELDSVMMNCGDLKDLKERLEFDNELLKQQYECVSEELKEKTRQSQTWYNCLQEARQEAGELKAELDSMKAEEANRNFRGKGNSLFGEVEDRRLELEIKLASIQTEHECLLKTYTITKQQLHRLKNQIAALLHVKGTRADSSQIERLETALAHSREEIKVLNVKLASIDKQQAESSQDSRLKEFHEAFSDFGDKKDYVDYLQLQLEESKKTIADLKKDFQTKTLLQLSESDKLRHTEGQLHKAECNNERLSNENLKLRLRVDELRVKLVKYTKAADKQEASGTGSQPKVSNERVTVAKGTFHKPNTTSLLVTKPLLGKPVDSHIASHSSQGNIAQRKQCVKPSSATDLEAVKKPMLKVIPMQSKSDIGITDGVTSTVTLPKKKHEAEASTNGVVQVEAQGQTVVPFIQSSQQEPTIAATQQPDELANTRKRQPSVRFDLGNVTEDTSSEVDSTDENEENSCPPQKRNRSPDEGSVFSANNRASAHDKRITVEGQRHAPVVIHVKKDIAKKNECAQQ